MSLRLHEMMLLRGGHRYVIWHGRRLVHFCSWLRWRDTRLRASDLDQTRRRLLLRLCWLLCDRYSGNMRLYLLLHDLWRRLLVLLLLGLNGLLLGWGWCAELEYDTA